MMALNPTKCNYPTHGQDMNLLVEVTAIATATIIPRHGTLLQTTAVAASVTAILTGPHRATITTEEATETKVIMTWS